MMGVLILHPAHHLAFDRTARDFVVAGTCRLYVHFSLGATAEGSEFPEGLEVEV
jgi:hypothetical protein